MKIVLVYSINNNGQKSIFKPIKNELSYGTLVRACEFPFKISSKTYHLEKNFLMIEIELVRMRTSDLEVFEKLSDSWIHKENLQKYLEKGIIIKGNKK